MSRGTVAAMAGVIGAVAYLVLVMTLADAATGHHWALDLLYFAVAGVLWTWPATALIRWVQAGRTGA